jgi:phosphotransferase system HPr (HPr) family protein
MIRRRVEVAEQLGLTATAAAAFVVLARRHRAEILGADRTGQPHGKSLADIATLAAPCGTGLQVEAWGPDAREAVATLACLIAARSDGTDGE